MHLQLDKARDEIIEEKANSEKKCKMIAAHRETLDKNIMEIAKLQTANTNLRFVVPNDSNLILVHHHHEIARLLKIIVKAKAENVELKNRKSKEDTAQRLNKLESFARHLGF